MQAPLGRFASLHKTPEIDLSSATSKAVYNPTKTFFDRRSFRPLLSVSQHPLTEPFGVIPEGAVTIAAIASCTNTKTWSYWLSRP
jgi:aconitase A